MSASPLSAIHTFSLLAVLAASPFGGCDDTDSVQPLESTQPIPTPGPGGGGGGTPHGGTPEPGTMLLVAGGAAGYVALRRRRKNGVETEAE